MTVDVAPKDRRAVKLLVALFATSVAAVQVDARQPQVHNHARLGNGDGARIRR